MAVAARRQVVTVLKSGLPLNRERAALFTKHSACVLDPHLVGDAGFGQAHELSERRVRPARAAGERRDQARDRGVAVPVQRAQVNVPSGAAGRAVDR
jgi:hypothetical protein